MGTPQYPLVRAEGTHYELGRQHGEQAASRIHAHLAYVGETLRLSREQLRQRAVQLRPLFERFCPHLLDEIDGLAAGARLTPADALAVNIRGALAWVPPEPPAGC